MSWTNWFRISGKSLFGIAFSLHRLTGVVLAVYLCMHLTYLTSLKFGKEFYESLIKTTVSPTFLVFDVLLILAGVYHGVNGLRLILHEFGFAYESRRALLYAAFVLTLILWFVASYQMYRFVMGV